MAERMGFWQSLMNKFKRKTTSSEEKDMIKFNHFVQNKMKKLNELVLTAKTELENNDLQNCYRKLVEYAQILNDIVDSSKIIINKKQKMASLNLMFKLAQPVHEPYQVAINVFKAHLQRFLNTTLEDNFNKINNIIYEELAKAVEEEDVSSYISSLVGFKEEVSDFSEKLSFLHDNVIVGHKHILNKFRDESKENMGRAFEDIGSELSKAPPERNIDDINQEDLDFMLAERKKAKEEAEIEKFRTKEELGSMIRDIDDHRRLTQPQNKPFMATAAISNRLARKYGI